ncbi:MAG: class I SAM-dependent methyltransferase [Anaerolineae bacterium]|nr:class I SAM-dependent methyltransferase [Anaerolineae bacterium]
MHERRYRGKMGTLRNPERVARLEPERVVDLCLEAGEFASMADVGTGSGLFAEAFAARGLAVAGVDVNPEMIEAATSLVPEGDFKVARAEALPFDENAYDVVFMGTVFHEADDQLLALGEAARVARYMVAILEWPYEEGAAGPPIEHRISPEQVRDYAAQTGLKMLQTIRLASVVLYLLMSA